MAINLIIYAHILLFIISIIICACRVHCAWNNKRKHKLCEFRDYEVSTVQEERNFVGDGSVLMLLFKSVMFARLIIVAFICISFRNVLGDLNLYMNETETRRLLGKWQYLQCLQNFIQVLHFCGLVKSDLIWREARHATGVILLHLFTLYVIDKKKKVIDTETFYSRYS